MQPLVNLAICPIPALVAWMASIWSAEWRCHHCCQHGNELVWNPFLRCDYHYHYSKDAGSKSARIPPHYSIPSSITAPAANTAATNTCSCSCNCWHSVQRFMDFISSWSNKVLNLISSPLSLLSPPSDRLLPSPSKSPLLAVPVWSPSALRVYPAADDDVESSPSLSPTFSSSKPSDSQPSSCWCPRVWFLLATLLVGTWVTCWYLGPKERHKLLQQQIPVPRGIWVDADKRQPSPNHSVQHIDAPQWCPKGKELMCQECLALLLFFGAMCCCGMWFFIFELCVVLMPTSRWGINHTSDHKDLCCWCG